MTSQSKSSKKKKHRTKIYFNNSVSRKEKRQQQKIKNDIKSKKQVKKWQKEALKMVESEKSCVPAEEQKIEEVEAPQPNPKPRNLLIERFWKSQWTGKKKRKKKRKWWQQCIFSPLVDQSLFFVSQKLKSNSRLGFYDFFQFEKRNEPISDDEDEYSDSEYSEPSDVWFVSDEEEMEEFVELEEGEIIEVLEEDGMEEVEVFEFEEVCDKKYVMETDAILMDLD